MNKYIALSLPGPFVARPFGCGRILIAAGLWRPKFAHLLPSSPSVQKERVVSVLSDVDELSALQVLFYNCDSFQEQSRYASRYFQGLWGGPHDPTRGPRSVLVLRRSPALDLLPLSPFSLRLTGAAIQKSCKRRIHVASSASTTTTQLPGPGAAFTSTGGTSNPTKLRSLYAHTSRRTHSTPSTPAPNSRKSSQGGQSEIFHAVASGTSEELASHLNKTFGALVFPPELATRLLTHASHPVSRVVGHNVRFAFTGEYFCPLRSLFTPTPYWLPSLCAARFEEIMNGTLTRWISFESRSPNHRSLFPNVPPLVSKRQLRRQLREYHIERPQHLHPWGTRRSRVGNWEGVKVEIDGGSADGCEGSG